jgi:hypothetical protein
VTAGETNSATQQLHLQQQQHHPVPLQQRQTNTASSTTRRIPHLQRAQEINETAHLIPIAIKIARKLGSCQWLLLLLPPPHEIFYSFLNELCALVEFAAAPPLPPLRSSRAGVPPERYVCNKKKK